MQSGNARALRVVSVLAVVGALVVAGSAAARDDEGRTGDDSGPIGQAAEQTTYGWILVPTPDPARIFSPMTAHGVTHFFVHATADAPYALEPQGGSGARLCAVTVCVQTSDFDIVFFSDTDGQSRVVGRASHLGNEAGVVPEGASFGLVFLKTPGLLPSAKGYGFVYREGGAGGDVLPVP